MPKFLGLFEPRGSLVSEVGRNSPNTIFVEFGVVLTLVELSRGFLGWGPHAALGFDLASWVGLNPRGGVNFCHLHVAQALLCKLVLV